jgi:histidyl-tRNA synthetase
MSEQAHRRNLIQPRVLKGFRDSLPEQEIPKRTIISKLETHFSSYGYVPIDTPTLEFTEVLLGKGGGETDKQIFHFTDNGGRDVAMRFDLTVPFARFMAQHHHQLPMPFKRYHINKVWRGENPQKGRYREFIQCDFDIVGVDSAEADYEILAMMQSSFATIGVERYTFHLAHRGLFNRMLSTLEISQHNVEILRIVDKIRSIGIKEVERQLTALTADEQAARSILSFITKEDEDEAFTDTLARLEKLSGGESEDSIRMRTIHSYLVDAGIEEYFTLDPSITRGLDYYTGLVYETFLTDLAHYGSVCSGGRYNDLAGLYTKQHLPGVGSSIGLDRLMSALSELNAPEVAAQGAADLAILVPPERSWANADRAARIIRRAGLAVSVYLADKRLGAQYKWAEANAIGWVLTETDGGRFTLKHLESQSSWEDLESTEVAIILRKEYV